MDRLGFSNWNTVLDAEDKVAAKLKQAFAITIRWYLSYCKRAGAPVDHDSARQFMRFAVDQKQPESWQQEQWIEAIRWFFRLVSRICGLNRVQVSARGCDKGRFPWLYRSESRRIFWLPL